jgi:transcriptional regulator with XRE-family HTH domain
MANLRLRDALLRNGMTTDDVAQRVGVDPKTVERWITITGRAPYPKHRHAVAAMLHESESYLWPDALGPETSAGVAESEVLKIYPNRNAITRDVWERLLDQATARIDVLVYVGMFLTENPAFPPTLRTKGAAGARVRLLLGDPDGREVQRRSIDEGIGKDAIPAKIRNVLAYFRQLDEAQGVELRCHDTTLYNSIYRYDDEMIVNPHVYGIPAPHAPALHVRRLSAGSMFETYARSFDAVWETAQPAKW